MDIGNFLTGHSEQESSLYANYDKVNLVEDRLTNIVNSMIPTAKANVMNAVQRVNSCKGVGSYMEPLDSSFVEGLLGNVGEEVNAISVNIRNKADSIKTFSEASTGEKILSTAAMVGAKVGEGFLSIFEGLGDGVVSLVGWLAPKDSGIEQACKQFVEKDWSHDLFNAYYNSEFAKKSYITEDSFLANAAKFGGQLAGFAVLGGGVSALGSKLGSSAGTASKIFNAVAGTEKRLGVTTAALMGMGESTQSSLQKGISMDEAAASGMVSGAIAGTLAYGIGTLVEKVAASRGASKAKDVFAGKGDDAVTSAVRNQGDDALRIGTSQGDDLLRLGTGKGEGALTAAAKSQGDDAVRAVASDSIFTSQGDDVLRLGTAKEPLALPGALEGGTPVGKTMDSIIRDYADDIFASKGDDVITTALRNQGDDAVTAAAKATSDDFSRLAGAEDIFTSQGDDVLRLGAAKEPLALPGALEDGTPVGRSITTQAESQFTRQQQLAQDYLDNLEDMLEKKVSIEQYFEMNGESISKCATRADAAELFRDANGEMHAIIDRVGASTGIKQRYLNRVDEAIRTANEGALDGINVDAVEKQVKSIFSSAGLDSAQQQEMWNIYRYKLKTEIVPDTEGLYSALQPHMTSEEASRLSSIVQDNYASRLASATTQAEKEAAYVYTKNGYEEMNSLLTGDAKRYYQRWYAKEGMSETEMMEDVFARALGTGNVSSTPTNANEVLQGMVRNNRVQDNIVVYRSVQDFGGLTKIKQLTPDTVFQNPGFTSATATYDDLLTIIGEKRFSNVALEIIIPKGSEAAYIEPFSGIQGYLQNEVLINPNSTLTILEKAHQIRIGGRPITVVKCLLS